MIVECARCGAPYNNLEVTSQGEADQELEVCDRCHDEVMVEVKTETKG